MSKYGVFSGPYFPVFSPNTGKYRPEKIPYLDTFHAVLYFEKLSIKKIGYSKTFWKTVHSYFSDKDSKSSKIVINLLKLHLPKSVLL